MLLSAPIHELYGLNQKTFHLPKDGMGIEIEFEKTYDFHPDFVKASLDIGFNLKPDGSLRGTSGELVSNPFSYGKDCVKVMEDWQRFKNKYLSDVIEGCPRASIHVHANMAHATYLEMLCVLTAYALLEGPMVAVWGRHRFGNIFALRIPEAPFIFDAYTNTIKTFDIESGHHERRYSALNTRSLQNLGTFEFRSMGADYNPAHLRLWLVAIDTLRSVAMSYKSPEAIYNRYSEVSRETFLREFLGQFGEQIIKNINYNELMEEGEEFALWLASANSWDDKKDWREAEDFQAYCKGRGYNRQNMLSTVSSQWENKKREKANQKVQNPHAARPDMGPEDPDDDDMVHVDDLREHLRVPVGADPDIFFRWVQDAQGRFNVEDVEPPRRPEPPPRPADNQPARNAQARNAGLDHIRAIIADHAQPWNRR